ncbi:MAG: phage holin family protein [Candidatus Gracilibacteria bacterium]|jgi:putative membrane protein|nr:phage holin family protein [Candidatus Gracilibacteria bacterium]
MKIIKLFILDILANAGALYGVGYYFHDNFMIEGGIKAFLIIGFSLGVLNTIAKPVLKLLSLPLMVVSMGLFLIVINMGILWFLQYLYTDILTSLDISMSITGGIKTFFITSVSLSILNSITHWLVK